MPRPGGAGLVASLVATVISGLTVVKSSALGAVEEVAFAEHALPGGLLAAGLVLVLTPVLASWSVSVRRPVAALGLALAQVAALLPLAMAWREAPAAAPPWLLSAGAFMPAGILLACLGWSRRAVGRMTMAGVAVVAAASLVSAAALAGGYDPFTDPGCARTCRHVPALMSSVVDTRTAVTVAGLGTLLAAAAGLVSLASADRRSISLVGTAGLVCLGSVCLVEAVRLSTWGDRPAQEVLPLVHALLPVPVAVAVLVADVQARRRRQALADVLSALSRDQPRGPERPGPLLGVDFARHDGVGWVDADGQPVVDEPPGRVSVLDDEHGAVVRLHLAPDASDDDVRDALTPAARLALRNAQLAASLRRRLREVQESQRRVVAASDAERTRIERDLHDGAQQRLVGVAFHLRLARGAADKAMADRLATAEEEVLGVLAHLRRLSHGIVPEVLTEEGLDAALVELVHEAPVPCRMDVALDGRVPLEAATAAYVAVAAMLAAVTPPGPTTQAVVAVVHADHQLRLDLEVTGIVRPPDGSSWVEAADRVGALGGRWDVAHADGRLRMEAMIPCES